MSIIREQQLTVPFFRPSLDESAVEQVTQCLRSGWLTSGPMVKAFERQFAKMVHAEHALALNSCTAALHLAVEALQLKPGQGVLVPTMTFAATAEIVRYQGAVPILVDCDASTFNMDLADAEQKLQEAIAGHGRFAEPVDVVGIIPVHVGGQMLDMEKVSQFARQYGLWVVEDAAHAFPAAFRSDPETPWRWCGEDTAHVTCFSFYANKTITTGEGGMAVTSDPALDDRMRKMALHGLSRDAWDRFNNSGQWDYRIIAPGYKYNLTDIAAAIGLSQLQKAESMRRDRQQIAEYYREELSELESIELPSVLPDRIHSWHLFPIRLRLDRLTVDRNAFLEALRDRGVGFSVHWRPLHLHPYYQKSFGWQPDDLPVASACWPRICSLPLFPGMADNEREHVVAVVRELCQRFSADREVAPHNRPRPR